MKVSGPNSGPGAGAPDATGGADPDQAAGRADGSAAVGSAAEVGATDASAAAGRTESSGRAFADKLAAAGTTASGTGSAAPARPAELHATAGIAAELDAGRLTPAAAVDKVLEQVLAKQVGADAPPAVRERVRAALQEALENDPLLAEKLRRLGA
jgi:hypothetical protein